MLPSRSQVFLSQWTKCVALAFHSEKIFVCRLPLHPYSVPNMLKISCCSIISAAHSTDFYVIFYQRWMWMWRCTTLKAFISWTSITSETIYTSWLTLSSKMAVVCSCYCYVEVYIYNSECDRMSPINFNLYDYMKARRTPSSGFLTRDVLPVYRYSLSRGSLKSQC